MRGLLYILLIVFASVLDIYLSKTGINPTTPAYSLLPLFFAIFIIRYNPKLYGQYIKTHSFVVFFIFLVLAAIYAIWPYASGASIMTDLVNAVITLLLYLFTYILFSRSKDYELKLFLILALLVLISSLLYDNFVGLPGEFEEELRKGGFAGNPNIAASAIKFLGFGLLYLYRKNIAIRWVILVVLILSVFLTFSRSGMLGMIILTFFLLLNNWNDKFDIHAGTIFKAASKLIIAFTLLYTILLTTVDYLKQEIPSLKYGDAGRRIDMLLGKSNGLSSGTRDDQGKYGRKGLLIYYVDKFTSNPFGYGTGYTADKSINKKDTHNFYLKAAINYGIFGLLLVLGFFAVSFKLSISFNSYYYSVFIFIFMVECIASHSVFVEKPTIIALAFMDSVLYASKRKS